jgi:hypothetical protein
MSYVWYEHEDPDCYGVCSECLDACLRYNEKLSHGTLNGFLHFYTCEGCNHISHWFEDYTDQPTVILPKYEA